MKLKVMAGMLAVVTLLCLALFFPKNISASESLTLLSTLPNNVNDYAIAGNYLYIARGPDLIVYNISDPSNPIQVGNFHDSCSFASIDVRATEGYLTQVQLWCNPNPDNFSLFNLSDPTNPIRIGESLYVGGIGSSNKVVGDGSYAYIIHAYTGLVIVDVRNPVDLKIVGTFSSPEIFFYDIKLDDNHAYITDLEGAELWVLDISDKTNPQSLGGPLKLPSGGLGLDIEGNYIYVSTQGSGLTVVDRSNVSDLKIIKTYPLASAVRDVDVQGNFAFLANLEAGATVLDISDPLNPTTITSFDTPDRVWQIKTSGNLVFANDPQVGLYILSFSEVSTPKVEPFLDLPWDYGNRTFRDAALTINSYFDHSYPLVAVKSLNEPQDFLNQVTTFEGENSTSKPYSRHDGYDYGSRAGARNGSDVLAAASGCAYYKYTGGDDGDKAGGNEIHIIHDGKGEGYQTRYLHLQSAELTTKEENPSKCIPVLKGQKIGIVGSTGNSFGAHIHFMVVQDKNGDGNFDDNFPDGVVDPFGWQGDDPDPWSQYSFKYKDIVRSGTKSHYLWTADIYGFSGLLRRSALNQVRTERFTYIFPENTFDQDVNISERGGSSVRLSMDLVSIGSSSVIRATDSLGNEVRNLNIPFQLNIDFSNFDMISYDINTLTIYSSPDGINWNPEVTTVDFANGIASAQINHLSYFVLMVRRNDLVAPVTTILLSGEKGEEAYYRSDVFVRLNVSDDNLGVDYALYKIDDGDWEEYRDPILIKTEGKHVINFYSVDKDENIEEIKEKVFYIDKTAPELRANYDKDNLKTVLEGVDEFGVSNFSKSAEVIVITDKAGNVTKVLGAFDLNGINDKLSFKSIMYSGQTEKKFINNNYIAGYKKDITQNLISVYQNWITYGSVPSMVATDYRTKTESTRVLIKENNLTKLDSWLSGIHLLSIYTQSGSLEYKY